MFVRIHYLQFESPHTCIIQCVCAFCRPQDFESAFWHLQKSCSKAQFDRRMARFADDYPHAAKYLAECPNAHTSSECECEPVEAKHSTIKLEYRQWVLYLLVEQGIQTFDVRTSNYSESENSRILTNGIRNATPFKMLLMLIRDVVKKANNSVLKAKLGMDRQNTFTQAALNKIEHHTRVEAGKFSVRYCAVSNIFSAPNFSI